MRMSLGVLRRDRELLAFPLLAAIAVGAVAGLFGALAYSGGFFERLGAAEGSAEQLTNADWVLLAAFYLAATFTGIFFNAALVAAALERLRGGNPTVAFGLRAAASRWPAILGWAAIATTVGLLLQAVRERAGGLLGRLLAGLFEGVWAYVTFFVVPVLVAEGVGPLEAIRRSGSLFRRSWGQQVTAAFGFGLVYFLATAAALAISVIAFTLHPVLGVAVGVVVFGVAIATVAALEGIFRAALYDFASGGMPEGFDQGTLRNAYRAL
jgi:hypothetical protein